MNNVSNRVEAIFSQAVALEQSGRLKNTVYAVDQEIFVLNSDNTVLLRFPLRNTEQSFASPVSFRAADYDSRKFKEEGGRIVFITEAGGFVKKKTCSSPEASPEEIKALFGQYSPCSDNIIVLHRDVLGLLDESLSHIELSSRGKKLVITQRNIYTGTIQEITRETKGMGLSAQDRIKADFRAIGMRTNDFIALFSFQESLTFGFSSDPLQANYCSVKGNDPKMPMMGVVAFCVYDELGQITYNNEK